MAKPLNESVSLIRRIVDICLTIPYLLYFLGFFLPSAFLTPLFILNPSESSVWRSHYRLGGEGGGGAGLL